MARKPDWIDVSAHIARERDRLQDLLPGGVECWLTLADYGDGPSYSVSLRHGDTRLDGYGRGSTPQKAFDAAKLDLAGKHADRQRARQVEVKQLTLLPPKGS